MQEVCYAVKLRIMNAFEPFRYVFISIYCKQKADILSKCVHLVFTHGLSRTGQSSIAVRSASI